MHSLVKYDGFLPKIDDNTPSSLSLFRVHNMSKGQENVRRNHSIALLIDTSGSMWSVMHWLIQSVISTVELILSRQITTLDRISLITFSNTGRVYENFRNLNELKNIVSHFVSEGGTSYGEAINFLIERLEKHNKMVTVMFSDGEPTDDYKHKIDVLKRMVSKKSFLFHAIGLSVNGRAENVLRDLTSVGCRQGYYQSIDSTEIEASMNVLVSHFHSAAEAYVNEEHQTRLGFFVDVAETRCFNVEFDDTKINLEVIRSETFESLLQEKSSIAAILDALTYLLEYYAKEDESESSLQKAVNIVDRVRSLAKITEQRIKSRMQTDIEMIANERKANLAATTSASGTGEGITNLKRQRDIVASSNKKVTQIWKEYADPLQRVRQIYDLGGKISEMLFKQRNARSAVTSVLSRFRDNAIADERKRLARFSSKLQDKNKPTVNIVELLQNAIDELTERNTHLPVPTYFLNYTDPLTLNNFQEIMLHKFGVFMLLITVERHAYGIVSPHMTKIIEVSGFSASILDTMMATANDDNSTLIFDFRGIGSGNAAIPLWINESHWAKARHVFGPFVGHAVAGNELLFTATQGSTLLALVLLHLRRQKSTEFNRELIRMTSETLRMQIDKGKWSAVWNNVTSSPKSLNKNEIPSIEIFLVFAEFIAVEVSDEKVLYLLAEKYRRANEERIKDEFRNWSRQFSSLESSSSNLTKRSRFSKRSALPKSSESSSSAKSPESSKTLTPKKENILLSRMFLNVFRRYLRVSSSDVNEEKVSRTVKKSVECYFMEVYLKNEAYKPLLQSFEKSVNHATDELRERYVKLDEKEKLALVLSVHASVLFPDGIIAKNASVAPTNGYSYDAKYVDELRDWCEIKVTKFVKRNTDLEDAALMKLLQTASEGEAEAILATMKRNSHAWAVLLLVLFRTYQSDFPKGVKLDKSKEYCALQYSNLIENMSIPLHGKLIMYTVYNSFDSENWIESNMVWRPNTDRRRRLKIMFPELPQIE